MNRKGEIGVGTIIMVAMGIIIAAIFIQAIGQNEGVATDKLLAYNESHVLATCLTAPQGQVNTSNSACNVTVDRNSTGEWQYAGCPLTDVVVRNATNTTTTANTDYVVFGGVIALQNTSVWYNLSTNRTYFDYDFCGIGYNTDSGSRGIAGLWTIFAVLGLVAFVLVGVRKDWFSDFF